MKAKHPNDWSKTTLIAFRFCFIYFSLYSLATQIAGSLLVNPFVQFRGLGGLWPMREITRFVGERIFHIPSPLAYDSKNPDTPFFWVQMFWIVAVAVVATAAWSAWDRRSTSHATLHQWFHLFIRLALASQMFEYGMTKIIPTQFPAPSLTTLVTPVGDLSLHAMLWTSIGAATSYEIFTGCAELLAGILLIVPRTATLGALIALADMVQVFALNMSYDVGVKQISAHLILLAIVLLAPEAERLADFFLRNRAAAPSPARAGRIAVIVQVVLALYLIAAQAGANWAFWHKEGGGRPRSPFYGIWNIAKLEVDGHTRPPSLLDYDRQWRRVLFDEPDVLVFQRFDDSFARYGVAVAPSHTSMALTKGSSRNWKGGFAVNRVSENRLVLDGEMDGARIRMELERVEFDTFRLPGSTFRWVRPSDPQGK